MDILYIYIFLVFPRYFLCFYIQWPWLQHVLTGIGNLAIGVEEKFQMMPARLLGHERAFESLVASKPLRVFEFLNVTAAEKTLIKERLDSIFAHAHSGRRVVYAVRKSAVKVYKNITRSGFFVVCV